MPASVRAALEAHVTTTRAQHRETLRFEQETAGNPRWCIGRKLRQYLQQRPPRQRATGNRTRDTWQRCIMQIGLEQFRPRRRRLVHRSEPTLELTFPVSRFPFPETREPDLPQLEICRLCQGNPEPRILPRGEREVGQRRARRREQRRANARRELGLGKDVHARKTRPRRPRQKPPQREEAVVLSLVPHPVPSEAAQQMLEQPAGTFDRALGQVLVLEPGGDRG